jgi:hypothetical protein
MKARCWTVAALLTLAGCGGGGSGPAATTPSAPAPSSAAPSSAAASSAAPSADDAAPGAAGFVAVVKDKVPEVAAGRSEEEIASIAEQVCVGLANDLPAGDIVAETRSLGTADAEATDQATARELVKLAIDKVCLDQADRVDEF